MSQLNGAYYGPPIPPPPPRKYYRRSSRGGGGCGCLSCCCGCIFNCILSLICKILTTLIIIAAIIVFLFWLIVRPNVLKFHATEATLTRFTLSNNTLHYDLAVNVSIRNPNRRLGVYYDHIDALAFYEDVRFASQTLEPFFQDTKNTTLVSPLFKGQRVMPLSADQASGFNRENAFGAFSIDVKLFMAIRFKFLLFKSHIMKTKIRCELHVPLKSRTATNTTKSAFQATECDWDLKRWWIN